MIDPIQSLAFSIQANPGVYAVLIGSGVSRAAKIPTGWEITLDLIRKLAVLHEETGDPEPDNWYLQKFGKEADYSDLLKDLVRTRAERQQLLRPYFEPNETEREQGDKEPTLAHRAMASLAAQGFIKVIVTTNFDRLMETALKDAGVEPTVLSSPDQVEGALPLIHTQCCVFKVHGDYLDTRIRNTTAELDEYTHEFDELLDRIFDEFGLIVCGWSGEWDGALQSAISRAKSRRFTTYWTVRGKPGDKAQKLIEHRRAQVIRIADADTFFRTVQEYVESIETFSRPHPLSTEAAVASLKRYLPESRYRIQLLELIRDTVEKVVEMTSGEAFAVRGLQPTTDLARERLRSYEAACETLLAMAPIGGYWAEEEHYTMWQKALHRLMSKTWSGGYPLWHDLQRYPSTLLLYALGLGAADNNRLSFLRYLLSTTLYESGVYREDMPAVRVLPPFYLFQHEEGMKTLQGTDENYQSFNAWIHDTLQPSAGRIIPDSKRYTLAFDRLEIFIALSFIYQTPHLKSWPPRGSFIYRAENRKRIFQEIKESLSTRKDKSPFVTSGLFGETTEDCEQVLAHLEELTAKGPLYWR